MAAALVENSSAPAVRRFESCAVVGSGASLLSSGHGRCIDAHQAVFRTNDAPVTSALERDIGRRTTWRVGTTDPFLFSVASGPQPRSVPPRSQLGAETHVLYCHLGWVGRCHFLGAGRMRAAMLHPALVDTVSQVGAELARDISGNTSSPLASHRAPPRKRIGAPSTGFITLLAAVHACDRVSAFGFSAFPEVQAESTQKARREQLHSVNSTQPHGTGCTPAKYYGPCTDPEAYFVRNQHHAWQHQWLALRQLERLGLVVNYKNPQAQDGMDYYERQPHSTQRSSANQTFGLRPCRDLRKPGMCEAKKASGHCPSHPWGCDATCETCTSALVAPALASTASPTA